MGIISRILDQITSKFKSSENKEIVEIKLSPEIRVWVDEYNNLGYRDDYIWKIYLKAKSQINFVPYQDKYGESLKIVNFLITMYVVVIDDIADKEQNDKLLSILSDIPFSPKNPAVIQQNKKEKEYVKFCSKIWNEVYREIQTYPLYDSFEGIFKYDIECIVNSIKYDRLINLNRFLINIPESYLNQVHSMKFMSMSSVELMCSPSLSEDEVSLVRAISTYIQEMLRIGNWISTWEREVWEDDFTSGMFAYAVGRGILSTDFLSHNNAEEIIQILKKEKVEKLLLDRWYTTYRKFSKFRKKSEKIDINTLMDGLEYLLKLELVSKGRK